MKLLVFGLSVSSAWGNGHATLWRGLIHALARLGHSVTFYERDTHYYAAHRDCFGLPNGELVLYSDFEEIRSQASSALRHADVGMITSYCPDAVPATELLLESPVGVRAYYDLDTPVTLAKLSRGEKVPYIGPRGLSVFDLTLSYTGGPALVELQRTLGAKRVAALYGSVDPALHAPAPAVDQYAADLSYLGTYAEDRQAALEALLLAPARALPRSRFAIGGSQYPSDFSWAPNIHYLWHVPPSEHAAFYCSARLNLNVTRAPMAAMGYCPSGRLFEAAACGAALISDHWDGLDQFFTPGEEILVAQRTEDVLDALQRSSHELQIMGRRARERALAEHTIERRALQLLSALEAAHSEQRSEEV
jgi:spore maturation protein CgeB